MPRLNIPPSVSILGHNRTDAPPRRRMWHIPYCHAMNQTVLTIRTPQDFDFTTTLYSHGWCTLPPFSVNATARTLERVISLPSGKLALCAVSERSDSLRTVTFSSSPLSPSERSAVRRAVSRCFRLSDDLSSFHHSIASDPAYGWIAQRRAGRLLRSPTVFEDLVKMICTTNCSWALTTAMVRNLCNSLGRSFGGVHRAFPSPAAIAASSEAYLRARVKAGYRASYLLELARSVDSGRIDPEQWLDPSIPASDVYAHLRRIKGVGDYAAGNMLKLLGRYEYLGLDSWVRAQYARLHHGGRRVKDSTIAKRYLSFGEWRGLLFWLEMTREWYDSKFPLVE